MSRTGSAAIGVGRTSPHASMRHGPEDVVGKLETVELLARIADRSGEVLLDERRLGALVHEIDGAAISRERHEDEIARAQALEELREHGDADSGRYEPERRVGKRALLDNVRRESGRETAFDDSIVLGADVGAGPGAGAHDKRLSGELAVSQLLSIREGMGSRKHGTDAVGDDLLEGKRREIGR